MLRKLLACLALLTGLTATGSPAQAEVAAAMASRIEASAGTEAVAHTATAAARLVPSRAAKPGEGTAPKQIFGLPVRVPSVNLGSDRTRE